LLPIANKPLLSYQIEYLERNGISKIIVVIEKRFLSKLEKYFYHYFKPTQDGTEVELIAVQDEDESANILKLLKDRIVVSI
jgi:translation initiation factor eIF-2B subunit gamma